MEFSDRLNDLIFDTFHIIEQVEEKKIRKNLHLKLTLSEVHLMQAVGNNRNQDITITDLAKMLSFAAPTVTVAVNKLEEKGYLKKVRSETDRRVVYVTLTPFGKKVDTVHRYIHKRMSRDLAKEFNEEEQAILLQGLAKIKKYFSHYLEGGM